LDCPEQRVKGGAMGKQHTSRDFAARVGERIQSLRRERGFSVRKFAEVAKCSASNIAHIERGRSSIQMRILRKFARALQVEPIDLLNVDPETNDIGYIFEKMRQDPATRTLVKEQLEAWDVMVGRSVLP
jgi:transcriptional regulator with XRE-family HTH domain